MQLMEFFCLAHIFLLIVEYKMVEVDIEAGVHLRLRLKKG